VVQRKEVIQKNKRLHTELIAGGQLAPSRRTRLFFKKREKCSSVGKKTRSKNPMK